MAPKSFGLVGVPVSVSGMMSACFYREGKMFDACVQSMLFVNSEAMS